MRLSSSSLLMARASISRSDRSSKFRIAASFESAILCLGLTARAGRLAHAARLLAVSFERVRRGVSRGTPSPRSRRRESALSSRRLAESDQRSERRTRPVGIRSIGRWTPIPARLAIPMRCSRRTNARFGLFLVRGRKPSQSRRPVTQVPSLDQFNRVVVKVGSSLLVDSARGAVKQAWLEALVADIAALHRRGRERARGVVGRDRARPHRRRPAEGRAEARGQPGLRGDRPDRACRAPGRRRCRDTRSSPARCC